MDLQEIRRLLLSPGVRLKGSRDYDPNERFSGCWAVLRGSDGEELLFILVDGAEVSNDHHPHQRLLYLRRPNGELRLLSRQLLYFDVAGLERMRWYRISLTLGILGFLVVVPVVLLIHGGGASHPKPHQT